VVHAILGGLLTVAGASGGIFLTDHIRKDILAVDGKIAENSHRVESIERALAQFQMLQTEGVLLGALSTGEAMRPELRKSFQALGFLIRKGSTSRMIEELNLGNLAGLTAERAEQNRLVDAAIAAQDLAAWDALLKFEMERESKLRVLQFQVQGERETLTQQRRGLETWLHNATNWTFILQQVGFFVVLLAGLIHQYDHATMSAVHAAHATNTSSLAVGDGPQQ
jgi:hypothetical protein